ncbi:hypothetical protein BU14_0268s0010 [Porphyra umbilicalis]|uniref:EGF-like domain-containing protein n=1 Tax=Porphyra umbilicalis TaxID=2786 RepID=A0A1X6P1L8_PORUM|nr:hypothetical protein BU14_0268s0010 [Porphyra umbilicalis]|eukprot:OSX74769.1 hypothetical protein BU14_0268s0010 [Porphyra umbilicalis]
MGRARVSSGLAVASGCLLALATASAASTLSRIMMPPGMRTIRTIVQQRAAGGSASVKAAANDDAAGAPGAADAFDPAKLIKLGDIDANGAVDYAYAIKAGGNGGGASLHLFLFGTDGQVMADRAIALDDAGGGGGGGGDGVLAPASHKLTSLDDMPMSVRPSMAATPVHASTPDCLFTDTECECDLKPAAAGSGTCYSHVSTSGDTSVCVERDCGTSYVCLCGGSQKCARATVTQPTWVATDAAGLPAGETHCARRRVAVATTEVVGPMPTPVPTPPPAGCTLTADRCTCGLKSVVAAELDTCAVHTGLDAAGRNVCAERDCKDGYVCDCSGGSTCAFEAVTKEFWQVGGDAPGGRKYCERASKTGVVAVCVDKC